MKFILTTLKGKVRFSLPLSRCKARELCQARYCSNPIRPDQKKGRTFCPDCSRSILKKNNATWKRWYDLRRNAQLRDKPFDISLTDWAAFYLTRPRDNEQWTVDGINPLEGYTLGNIQWLNLSDNARKGATFDKQAYAAMKRGATPTNPF
jgi:DNA-directed RNA polymerase subunit RPC12/RpoP